MEEKFGWALGGNTSRRSTVNARSFGVDQTKQLAAGEVHGVLDLVRSLLRDRVRCYLTDGRVSRPEATSNQVCQKRAFIQASRVESGNNRH